ncbi:hypothetical protein DXG03_001556, partial [Asterophora parasitica]
IQFPLITFVLPEFDEETTLDTVHCHAEPNPTLFGTPHSTQPFTQSPHGAVICFHIHIEHDTICHVEFAPFARGGMLRDMAERARRGEWRWVDEDEEDEIEDESDVNDAGV